MSHSTVVVVLAHFGALFVCLVLLFVGLLLAGPLKIGRSPAPPPMAQKEEMPSALHAALMGTGVMTWLAVAVAGAAWLSNWLRS